MLRGFQIFQLISPFDHSAGRLSTSSNLLSPQSINHALPPSRAVLNFICILFIIVFTSRYVSQMPIRRALIWRCSCPLDQIGSWAKTRGGNTRAVFCRNAKDTRWWNGEKKKKKMDEWSGVAYNYSRVSSSINQKKKKKLELMKNRFDLLIG